jgi:hypothetical protein
VNVLSCPCCNNIIKENPKSYGCNCGFKIWKEIAGKQITPEIARELCVSGRTAVMDGFMSRTGKPFSAALVVQNGKVAFEFPARNGQKDKENSPGEDKNTVRVRVQSGNSGSVHISITGPVSKEADISYGLVPARMAECLGCITAVKLVKHLKNPAVTRINFSINNLEFSRYLLKERTPRAREMRQVLEYLWNELREFAGWQAQFKPEKRPRLKGSPQASFPRGVFPWLDVKVVKSKGNISVSLPDSPDVQAQFRASLWKARPGENGTFVLPLNAEQALNAWIKTVKSQPLNQDT